MVYFEHGKRLLFMSVQNALFKAYVSSFLNKGEIKIEYDESFNIRGFSSKCFYCIFSIFCY